MIWERPLKERTVSLLVGACFLMGAGTAIADIGTVQWQKIFNVDDGAWNLTSFQATGFRNDGTLMISGSGSGGIVVRYDAETGDVLDTPPEWIDYDSGSGNSNYFNDQVIDSNGDIYIAGRHDSFDPGLWKYNSSAVLQASWPKIHAVTGDGLYSGIVLGSAGFVYSVGYNNSDWFINKHAISDGTIFAGFPLSYDSNGFIDKASKVATDSEDNFIVVGWVGVDGSTYDWHVRKYASDGSLLWKASYDLKGNTEAAIDIGVDSQDNIIVCGYRNNGTDESAGMDRDWYIVKYAKDGDGSGGATILWEQSWNGGNGSASRVARALVIDNKDNVYVGGEQNDSSNAARNFIQYRDGQTGALISSQDLWHPVTVNGAAGTAGTENDYIKDLALNGEQLLVVGDVWEGYKVNGRTAWITMIKLLPGIGTEAWNSIYNPTTSPNNAVIYNVGFTADGNILAAATIPWSQGIAIRYNPNTGAVIDSPPEWISVATRFWGQFINSNGDMYFAGLNGTTMNAWKFDSTYTIGNAPDWTASDPTNSVNVYNIAVDSLGNSYTVGIKDNAVTSSTGWDGIINKYNSNGDVVTGFPIKYDYQGLSDGFFDVAIDSDNNFIVVGRVTVDAAVDHTDWYVQKYDSGGTLLWDVQYDFNTLSGDTRRVVVDSDDNIIVTGYVNNGVDDSTGSDLDWFIVKYAKNGDGSGGATILWQQSWDDGTRSHGYAEGLVLDERNNFYVAGLQQNSDGKNRAYIQYRDGQTGALLKIKKLTHVQTVQDNPVTEDEQNISLALKEGKLVASGWIQDQSNPSTHYRTGFVIALDRTFVVTPSATGNGTIDPSAKVTNAVYNTTVAFTLTPDTEYAPTSPAGTCPLGSAPTDNGDGTWLYSTGAITADCTVEFSFTLAKIGGDINGDSTVDLIDAILGLQILVGIEPSATVSISADFNDDGRIGLEEVISVLRKMAGLPFLSYDCNGDRDGTAYLDNCSVCVEGNTGLTPCVQDCNNEWGGTAVADNCGVCDDDPANDNTTCTQDCNGDLGGSAYVDNCSICVGGTTGQSACTQDCSGTWGGTATTDSCGVCDDDDTNNNTTCTGDCSGTWGGSAYLDICNGCVGGNTGYSPCGEVTSLTGRTWLDRNLGASRVAQSSADSIAYGGLYQWGRLTDGHESRTSPLTSARSSGDIPGHGSFIYTNNSYVLDWRVSKNDSLWQGTSGTNNPCPAGFRLPTYVELNTEIDSWTSRDRIGAFNSPLKLVTSGVRTYTSGYLRYVGSIGYYWSSTITPGGVDAKSYNMGFNDSTTWAGVRVDARATGYSVRCIKDN